MLFRKLKIEPINSIKGSEKWYLILQTFEDVIKYMKLDTELHINAMLSIPDSIKKSHLEGTRERVINTMIQTRVAVTPENKKVYPHDVLADLIDGKSRSMIRLIEEGQKILVQQHGTYCTYDGYVESWNATVTGEIEKDTCFYPTDNDPIETDILFIENGERVPISFENEVDKLLNYDINKWSTFNDSRPHQSYEFKDINKSLQVKYKLTHLKLKDPAFVLGMISKAKVIAFESQFTDTVQIDNMMKIFLSIPHKEVIIKSGYAAQIKEHELFEQCNNKHKLTFI